MREVAAIFRGPCYNGVRKPKEEYTMNRTKLKDRILPDYTRGEELMNTVTHIVGAALGVIALVLCILEAASNGNVWGVVASGIYGASMIALYCVSSIYHGMKPGMAKKVMQGIDHCTIFFLIAGTYPPIVLSAIRPVYPALAWGLFGFVWILAIIAVVLTAIDLKKYNVFSMICYVGIGWAVLPFMKQTLQVLTLPGFLLLLAGGIAYTIGAVLYGVGGKRRWMHSVFHIFVVLGSGLQFLSILGYAL